MTILTPVRAPRRVAPAGAALLVALTALACGDGTGTDDEGGPGLTIAGDGLADTIGTVSGRALMATVRDQDGRLVPNTVVRFEASTVTRTIAWDGHTSEIHAPAVHLGALDRQPERAVLVDTTDSRGRAFALVALGPVAGPAEVRVTVPAFGWADTARYTVRAGRVAGVVVTPADSALTVGASYAIQGVARDRYGNPRVDAVTLSVGTGPLVLANGRVSGTRTGRGTVIARIGDRADTAHVTVVPTGTIAAYHSPRSTGDSMKVVVMNSDGSGKRTVLGSLFHFFGDWGPTWHPTQARIVWQSAGHDPRLFTLDLNGAQQRLIQSTTVLDAEAWAQYSADGQWIYFGGRPDHQNGEIWRVRSDGTAPERVGPAADFYAVDNHPSPSPDGTQVVYYTNRDNTTNSLRILDLATRATRRLGAVGLMPRWSPDGAWIAFLSEGAIKLIRPDGTGARQLSPVGRSYGYGFSWSPDAAWIVAHTASGIEFIEVATGQALPLPGTAQLVTPSWRR